LPVSLARFHIFPAPWIFRAFPTHRSLQFQLVVAAHGALLIASYSFSCPIPFVYLFRLSQSFLQDFYLFYLHLDGIFNFNLICVVRNKKFCQAFEPIISQKLLLYQE